MKSLFAAFLALCQLAGQTATGNLVGVVKDADSGVIPGATIAVTIGGSERKAISNSSGEYHLDGLPAGKYQMTAALAGFSTKRSQVEILGGLETRWNVTLNVPTGHTREPANGIDPTDPRLSAPVYETVLRRMSRGSLAQPTVVLKSLIPPFEEGDDWPARLAIVPVSVRQASQTTEARKPVMLRRESLPSGARLIETPKISDIPTISLSRVFFSEDTLGALVVSEEVCGTLCATGQLIWLVRSSTTDPWRVQAALELWVS